MNERRYGLRANSTGTFDQRRTSAETERNKSRKRDRKGRDRHLFVSPMSAPVLPSQIEGAVCMLSLDVCGGGGRRGDQISECVTRSVMSKTSIE